MNVYEYDRQSAVDYALKWAKARNPEFYNFDNLGGDCTNFVSQCLFAGSGIMNYTKTTGWYYKTLNSRAPAWSGVPFLYNFLVNNDGTGVFGERKELSKIKDGDVIFMVRNNIELYHAVIVSRVTPNDVFVCSHTFDAINRPLSTYLYQSIIPIRILGYRK